MPASEKRDISDCLNQNAGHRRSYMEGTKSHEQESEIRFPTIAKFCMVKGGLVQYTKFSIICSAIRELLENSLTIFAFSGYKRNT